MFKTEIKQELEDNFQPQCRGCLSMGRDLRPIGNYYDLYCKLLEGGFYGVGLSSDSIQVCWECTSLLRKFSQFKEQVRKANEMIRIGQNYIFGTLSSLTTVIIHDTQPNIIYVNETNIQSSTIKQNIDENDDSHDSITNDNETAPNIDETELKIDVKHELSSNNTVNEEEGAKTEESNLKNEQTPVKKKVKYKNKWAEKRALLNKQPKFKIVTNKDLVIEKYFRRVHIDVDTVRNFMERKRDKEEFRKSSFKCERCVVVFKSDRLLIKHNNKYHEEIIGEYTCDICKRRFPKKRHLSCHINRHTIRFECRLCKYSCRSKEDINMHINNKHKKFFQCLQCELPFSCRQEFFQHYKEWHEKFICDHCGVSFKMRYCIEDHMKKKHSPFECVPCNKRFARYNGLWFHNKVCHTAPRDGAPATAYCVECDKRFPDVYRYKWHLHNSVKHTPKKKIKIPCPDCNKVFSKNIYMKDHHNLIHLKNFKYRCEECNKNFVRNADLVKHRRRIHEGVLPPRNKICYVCGRGFTTNEILTHHVRTHTGERPHRCAACPAAFAQRAALTAHARAPHPKAKNFEP
ncbi:hypothetical protein ABMA27_012287 [Loxostege sticticalis]|uniref:C2H2-type domain-containing protein n=1 Tax=Loxostege sticticalis TaxID=481309 RepID=A0ABR3H0R9_LOXSC